MPGVCVSNQCAHRDQYGDRFSSSPDFVLALSVLSIFRCKVVLVLEGYQRVQPRRRLDEHVSSLATISAGRTTKGDALFAPKGHATIAPFASSNSYFRFVKEQI